MEFRGKKFLGEDTESNACFIYTFANHFGDLFYSRGTIDNRQVIHARRYSYVLDPVWCSRTVYIYPSFYLPVALFP